MSLISELSQKIARDLFRKLDLGDDKCQRLAAKGGSWPDNETSLGGWCEAALANAIHESPESQLVKTLTPEPHEWEMIMKLKTKLGSDKNDKIAGAGHKHADWIPKSKVKSFRVLFDKIREKLGSYTKAQEFIGLSNCVIDGFFKDRLSAVQGKKILDSYNKIKQAPCNPENQ